MPSQTARPPRTHRIPAPSGASPERAAVRRGSTAGPRGSRRTRIRTRPRERTARVKPFASAVADGRVHSVRDRVERRPQNRGPDRPVVHAPSGRRLALEEGLVEAGRLRDVAVVEVAVLVLERDVLVELERSQVREVLHLVGRIQPRRDRRQRHDEQEREQPANSRRVSRKKRAEAIQKGDEECYLSATCFRICARLNPAWLTTGAMMLPRRR